jgi:siroheme decarboxylase
LNNLTVKKTTELISRIQHDFPIADRPFLILAEKLGCTQNEIMSKIKLLIHDHTLREFGPVFDPVKLGYSSTLIAAKVEPERVAELSASLLDIHEITHNYYREGQFNVWFTITARSLSTIEIIVRGIEKFPGVMRVLDLPAFQIFKISTVFDSESSVKKTRSDTTIIPISENEKKVIRALQNGLPIVERPFIAVAEELGMAESNIFDLINRWIENGTIRRFGARVNHRLIGYNFNTLAVWDGENVELWGEKFAEIRMVSHCYMRKSYPEWPYKLYTMIHARDWKEMQDTIQAMKTIAEGADMATLKTLYELKKVSMKYFVENEPWNFPLKG